MYVLHDMNCGNRVGVVVLKRQFPNVADNIGGFFKIDTYPFVPSNTSRAAMEED